MEKRRTPGGVAQFVPGNEALRRVPGMEDGKKDQITGQAVKWTGGGQFGAFFRPV